MAKLFFKYSTMNAGKSIDLIRINHNYIENGKKTICLTPEIDNRYGVGKITSRIGISIDAIPIKPDMNIFRLVSGFDDKISCVFVDEVQFISKEQIYQLSDIVDFLDIPVICYGLRTDFQLKEFPTSSYLFSIADSVIELKTICSQCKEKKATVNARFYEGKITVTGNKVQIGDTEYKPMCRHCYKQLLNKEKI